jgi:hypothetical protein
MKSVKEEKRQIYIHCVCVCVCLYRMAQNSCDIWRSNTLLLMSTDRHSAVGIATRYDRNWRGRDFPHPSRLELGFTQPAVKWVPGIFRGVKRPARGANHPSLSSAEVKESVELYLYYPSELSWPVTGRTYLFYLHVSSWQPYVCVCVCVYIYILDFKFSPCSDVATSSLWRWTWQRVPKRR